MRENPDAYMCGLSAFAFMMIGWIVFLFLGAATSTIAWLIRRPDRDAPARSAYIARMTQKTIDIWTDGACSGNPGPGGWGAVLKLGRRKDLSGVCTRHDQQSHGADGRDLSARSAQAPQQSAAHTDSKYVMDGVTKWIFGWKKNGWKTADKKPVKNEDLWKRLDEARNPHEIEWKWVKGHSGDVMNDRVDALAREAIVKLRGG